MATTATFSLDHKVEIRIPTQCGDCKKALLEQIRAPLLEDAKRDFGQWFGGFEVTRKHGGYTFPDGTLAEEEVDVVESSCSETALEEHLEDLALFAVRVANELSQDSVALTIDGKMRFYDRTPGTVKCLHAKKGAALSLPSAAPPGRAPKSDLEKMQALYAALDNSKFNINSAKYIFSERLSYDLTDETLPWRDWPKDLRERLNAAPQVLAYARGFKIVYLHQATSQLSRGATRAVISRILRDNANSFYGLFVVSNDAGDAWELVNARIADGKANRLILRRIPVGTGKGARTATDRLILVDLDGREKLTAQQIEDLHDGAFDVEGVSKEFYKKIAAWYFWAQDHQDVVYPRSVDVDTEADKSIFFIRLLTRLIFCWFMRQKGLIPQELFNLNFIKNQLKDADSKSGDYYKAILQNLFFATLNREINERSFRIKYEASRDGNYGVTTLYRYADLMNNSGAMLEMFKKVPFVNGGLFECLDDTVKKPEVRLDDFSENAKNNICLPNELFFGQERDVDLSKAFGDTKHKQDAVAGLMTILNQYQFTVEENTPLDQSVALDPELMGKVFENLLASYNEETKTTARKALGAFYTPREIVEHMVDESLLAYLQGKMSDTSEAINTKLSQLLAYNNEPHGFSKAETQQLIAAIDNLKALDPAVGSGAFPMGMLHKLVHVLGKLDPGNEQWKARQLDKIEDVGLREDAERAFRDNPADYGRKLYLIENCIYGVDIQPIAVQIAKMRFFISLIVDQNRTEDAGKNYGILALPNLETKFVAANTLIGIDKPKAGDFLGSLFDSIKEVKELDAKLRDVRHRSFSAKTPATKRKIREEDKLLREQKVDILKAAAGWSNESARKFAAWDPYNQNTSSPWFDPESMFGITDGFDIVIGNPPWGQKSVKFSKEDLAYLKITFPSTSSGIMDIFRPFIEKGISLLKMKGFFSFVLPDIFLLKNYDSTRKYVLDNLSLICVDHWGMAFDNVNLESCTIVGVKLASISGNLIRCNIHTINETLQNSILQEKFYKNEGYKFNLFLSDSNSALLDKLRIANKYCDYFDSHEGIHSGNIRDKLFLDKKIDNYCKKLIFGRDEISRYYLNWKGKWVNYNKAIINKKYGEYAGLAKPEYFVQNKLVVRRTGDYILAALDEHGYYFSNNVFVCVPKLTNNLNLLYVLGILNSSISTWFYRAIQPRKGKLFAELKINVLNQLPIMDTTTINQNKISKLVLKIIECKKMKSNSETIAIENEIDDILFNVYGLTSNDIDLIKG